MGKCENVTETEKNEPADVGLTCCRPLLLQLPAVGPPMPPVSA